MTYIGEHKKDILQLIMLMLIGLILYKMVFLVAYKSYIVANWPNYRCNPAFMPLTGLLNIPDPKSESGFMTVKKNIKHCLMQRMGEEMGKHLKAPLTTVGRLVDGHAAHTKAISNHHSYMSGLQGGLTTFTGKIKGKFNSGASLMKYYAIKFKELFKKLFAVFITMIYIMKTMESTLKGLFLGPIGQGMAEFACFTGDTILELNDKTETNIENLKLGDKLKNNNEVIGLSKSVAPNILYKHGLNGSDKYVLVTGSHKVYENGGWTNICDSKNAKEHDNSMNKSKRYDYVYNIVTRKNIIEINDIIYTDYCECSNAAVNSKVRHYLLYKINEEEGLRYNTYIKDCDKYHLNLFNNMISLKDNYNIDKYDNKDYYMTGLVETTNFILTDYTNKNICSIEIGDNIRDSGRVTSIVKYKCNNISNLYIVNGVAMSMNTMVLNGKEWVFAHDIGRKMTYNDIYKIFGYNTSIDKEIILYSIGTGTGIIHLNNMKLRDLNETYSCSANKVVDNMILKYLNNTPPSYKL